MLVHIGMGDINVIYHIIPGKTNIITKKSEIHKTIIALDKIDSTKEIRDFDKDPSYSGKVVKLDQILDISSIEEFNIKYPLSAYFLLLRVSSYPQ